MSQTTTTEQTEPTGYLKLIAWRAGSFPHDWDAVLAGTGPLHLEVGFGDGRYTALRAKEDPTGRFVGIELSGVSVQRALRRMRREQIANVAILKGEAHFLLRQLFEPGSLSTITVNFPDPWPKGRHEENRLLRADFFRLAASRLIPGGSVLLATDHPEYLEFARAQALDSGLFTLTEAEPPPAVFETKYALKWKTMGKPLYYQPFVRNQQPAGDYPHLERPDEMPHSLLEGPLPATTEFSKRVSTWADGHVILHEAALSAGEHPRWLIRATVDEPELRQQLVLVVQPRQDGELIVRLESFGDPIVTDTVRGAVHAVTEWALEQPGVSLKARRY